MLVIDRSPRATPAILLPPAAEPLACQLELAGTVVVGIVVVKNVVEMEVGMRDGEAESKPLDCRRDVASVSDTVACAGSKIVDPVAVELRPDAQSADRSVPIY